MKKIALFFSLILSYNSFSQQIATKTIQPSVLRKIVSDDAIVEKALQFEDKNGKTI